MENNNENVHSLGYVCGGGGSSNPLQVLQLKVTEFIIHVFIIIIYYNYYIHCLRLKETKAQLNET